MNNLVSVSHHYLMLLKLLIKLKSTSAAKLCGLPFQTREIQQGIPRNLGTNLYMRPYDETVSCWEFILAQILQKSSQGHPKFRFLFIKTSKWEKW